MNAPFAATLICLCCQASAMACYAADDVSQAPRTRILVAAAAPIDPAMASTLNDATTVAMAPVAEGRAEPRAFWHPLATREVQNRPGATPSATPPGAAGNHASRQSAPPRSESPETGGTLLLVGVVLMVAIALRRWGTGSR